MSRSDLRKAAEEYVLRNKDHFTADLSAREIDAAVEQVTQALEALEAPYDEE